MREAMTHFLIFSGVPFITGIIWGVRLGRRRQLGETPTFNINLSDQTKR
jgi:hypothetical protein